MSDLLQKIQFDMQLKGFAPSTQKNYLMHIRHFQNFIPKPLETLGYDDVRTFLHHAITVRKLSPEFIR